MTFERLLEINIHASVIPAPDHPCEPGRNRLHAPIIDSVTDSAKCVIKNSTPRPIT